MSHHRGQELSLTIVRGQWQGHWERGEDDGRTLAKGWVEVYLNKQVVESLV